MDQLLDEAGIEIVAVTPDQARIARQAYRDFGKGRGHRAQLDFGDCFAYALPKVAKRPSLRMTAREGGNRGDEVTLGISLNHHIELSCHLLLWRLNSTPLRYHPFSPQEPY